MLEALEAFPNEQIGAKYDRLIFGWLNSGTIPRILRIIILNLN